MTDLEKAREFFAADRYATEVTGIEIIAVDEHYAKCQLNIEGRHKNAVVSRPTARICDAMIQGDRL